MLRNYLEDCIITQCSGACLQSRHSGDGGGGGSYVELEGSLGYIRPCLRKQKLKACEVTQWVQLLLKKPGNWSSKLGTHIKIEGNVGF